MDQEQYLEQGYIKYPDEKWIRMWIPTYNDAGWIIGEQGEYYVVWLDSRSDKPILITEQECGWEIL